MAIGYLLAEVGLSGYCCRGGERKAAGRIPERDTLDQARFR